MSENVSQRSQIRRTPAPAVAKARASLAGLTNRRSPGDPAIVEARRDLRAEKLADHIARELAESPPFTTEQRTQLLLAVLDGGDAA